LISSTEVLKMGECVLCRETVTNPVCPECLAEEMAAWLGESRPDLVDGLRLKTKGMAQHLFDDNKCVLCGKDLDVCSYCFTEHIFEWLLSLKEHALLKEYMVYFNYDLGGKGYRLKAESECVV
jgi:ferredoxin